MIIYKTKRLRLESSTNIVKQKKLDYMNTIEFNERNAALRREMEKRMDEPENKRHVIYDGVMKPELYFSRGIRLAWMLKEPYDLENGTGGGWNYFDMFPDGENLYETQFNKEHKSTWQPMIYISYGIHNNFQKWENMEYLRDKNEMCEIVREVAFINSQKLPAKGFTNTNFSDLWESINKNADLLKKQIELINPNVFIFANTIELYEGILDLNLSQLKSSGSSSYIVKDGKLFISAYHPSQRGITRDKYINDIISIVEKWSKNEIQD